MQHALWKKNPSKLTCVALKKLLPSSHQLTRKTNDYHLLPKFSKSNIILFKILCKCKDHIASSIVNLFDHFFQNCVKIFDNYKGWCIVKIFLIEG